jgi:hypothetical protein
MEGGVMTEEQEERRADAKKLSRKLVKALVGYEGATAILAIAMTLQHIAGERDA